MRDREMEERILKDIDAHVCGMGTLTKFGVPENTEAMRLLVAKLHDEHAVPVVDSLRALIDALEREPK